MIRVLQVIHSMNLGGAENFIMNVYRVIDKTEIQFDFLVNKEGVFDDEIRQLGGYIWRMPYVSEVGPFRYHLALRKFFQKHSKYEVIHSHLDMVSGEVISCAKKEGVKYCITHSHNTDTTGNIAVKWLKQYYQLKIESNADLCLACSEQAGHWLYKNEDAIVIKNAINIEKFCFKKQFRDEIRKKLNISEHTMVIGHVGRFSKVKNHRFLVQFFERYHDEHENTLLLLCGSGDEKNHIEKIVADKGLSKYVIFVDAVLDVYKMYSVMDVLVFPSLYEGMPLVIMEAQANGLPIVASSVVNEKCAVTPNIQFVKLDVELVNWIEAVEKASQQDRIDGCEMLRKAGYDIREIAEKLVSYYKNMNKKEKKL